jgi:LysM repeat protein
MRHRSPARFLAPLALLACAVAVFAVVQSTTSSSGDKSSTGTISTSSKKAGKGTTKGKAASKARSYTVKPGDVLSAIAVKTGTSTAALEAANPDLDPAALHPGQKLKLPR